MYLSIKSGKTPTNSKFSKIMVIFGISVCFDPENMYHVHFAYSCH